MELSQKQAEFMSRAIALSELSVKKGGGPFGAVVVKDEYIVGEGYNSVTLKNDPTAHAEIEAIREAAASIGSFELRDCEIYTSCEPCPMCLGAIYWSGITRIYYGNNKNDAARIGFDDQFIYEELERPFEDRKISLEKIMSKEAAKAFKMWEEKDDKIEY